MRGTYYDFGKDFSPFGTAFIGNSWKTGSGKRIGFLLSGSYTDYSLRHERIGSGFNIGVRWRPHNNHGLDIDGDGRTGESVGSAGKPNAHGAILFPGNLYNDSETRDIDRGFVNAAFSFEPSRDLKLSFEATHRFDTTLRNRDELRILSPFDKTNKSVDFRFTQHAGVTIYDAQKNVVSIDLDYRLDGDFFRSIEFGYLFNDQSLDRERRNKNLTAGLPGRNDPITNFADLYDRAYSGGEHPRWISHDPHRPSRRPPDGQCRCTRGQHEDRLGRFSNAARRPAGAVSRDEFVYRGAALAQSGDTPQR